MVTRIKKSTFSFCFFLPLTACVFTGLTHAQTHLDDLVWGIQNLGKTQQIAIDHYTTGNILGVNGEDIHLPPPGKPGRKVIVAILDTGADFTHPQLKNVLMGKGYNAITNTPGATDNHGHGTHVAGIIGAEIGTSGFQGVSQNVRILPIKVIQTGPNAPIRPQSTEPGAGTALTETVAKGLVYAIQNGAEVINLSLAWPASFRSKQVDAAMAMAREKNVVIVSSAGNDSTTANVYPCIYENVVCVGAQGPDGAMAHFSNYGSMVDLLAPGTAILSTWPLNKFPVTFAGQIGYEFRNGTSMSAPFVTGAIAELLSRGYPPREAVSRLLLGARPTASQKLFSSQIVGHYSHDQSNEIKNTRFGNLDISRALSLSPSPLILPKEKGVLEIEWDGVATQLSVPIEWVNHWSKAQTTQISVDDQAFSFDAIPEMGSVTTQVTLQLGANPESTQHLKASVKTQGYEKKEIEITLQLIRILRARSLPPEAKVISIQGVNTHDFTDVRTVINSDHLPRTDLVLFRNTENGIEFALIQDHQYFNSVILKDLNKDQFLQFYRLPDQSYVAIFTKPDPKVTRPDFFIETFDPNLKLKNEIALGTDTTVLPESFQWMPYQNSFTPVFIALGLTPPLDLPKYDPWNPKFQDSKTLRLYYLVGSDLRIVPLSVNQLPLQILSDGRVVISEGNTYFQKYKILTLLNGKNVQTTDLRLDEYRMLIGQDAGIQVLKLDGSKSDTTAITGTSSPGNLRTTAIGSSPFDQVLARSTLLDALMMVNGVYSDSAHQYFFAQSHYDFVFYTSGQNDTLSTSLNRYSFIPSLNFNRNFYPTLVQSQAGTGMPAIYVLASQSNSNISEIIVADLENHRISKPARFRFQVQDSDCQALGNLISAQDGKPAQEVFVCGNNLIQMPLQLSHH